MFSQLFILSARGDAIIFRDYRSELPKSTAEVFFREVCARSASASAHRLHRPVASSASAAHSSAAPCFNVEGINFVYVEVNGLLLALSTLENVSPALGLDLLRNLSHIIKDFCGVFTEESVRRNFVLIYEVVDELLDFGYPQYASTAEIRPCVCNKARPVHEGPRLQLPKWAEGSRKTQASNAANRLLDAGTEADNTNEVYVDLIENISAIFDANGTQIHAQLDGELDVRSYLHGEPTIHLAFNRDMFVRNRDRMPDPSSKTLALDDIHFHPCVDADAFDVDRSITWSPPQGFLCVATYRVSMAVIHPPIIVSYKIVETSPSSVELYLTISPRFREDFVAKSITVACPVPPFTDSVSFQLRSAGEEQMAEFSRKESTIVWNIDQMHGTGEEERLLARISLMDRPHASSQALGEIMMPSFGPISVDFEIAMLLLSGTRITQMDMHERSEDYSPLRWVRYLTQSNSYVFRV